MLELPEVLAVAEQLRLHVTGKRVAGVLPPSKPHKLCWYLGEPAAYDEVLRGSQVTGAEGFGLFVEIAFDNGRRLCFNDGVNPRLVPREKAPKNHQLLIAFEDGLALVFTVAMYGGIILHDGSYDNDYYRQSRQAITPLAAGFADYYRQLLAESKPTLSVKAFLATEQRFPGIGNGVLQDILLAAGLHPKRRINTLSPRERDRLLDCVTDTLGKMIAQGGRDTEKGIFGQPGGYPVRLSKNTLTAGCPLCGGPITKEAYLGGSVYFCPVCQPLAQT